MTISELLTPREEVLNDQVQGILQAHKVEASDEERVENSPKEFLRITYPSDGLKNLIELIDEKLQDKKDQGGYIISGSYGSGKTHAIITLYHLFQHSDLAQEWLEEWNLQMKLPSDAESIIVATKSENIEFLWEPIFKRAGREDLLEEVGKYPTTSLIEEWVGEKTIAVFFDEIETWYQTFDKEEEKHKIARNEMFLQSLLEVAKDPNHNLLTFITKLEKGTGLDKIINRSQPGVIDVSAAGDREKIIFHRTFKEKREDIEEGQVKETVRRYLSCYTDPIKISNREEYKRRMIQSYPFHPQLLEVVDGIYDIEEAQNVRGEMDALATAVRQHYEEKDLLLLSDLDPNDFRILSRRLVKRYESDKDRTADITYSNEILRAILIHSLNKTIGVASPRNILLATLTPDTEKIEVQMDLEKINEKAVFVHPVEGGYQLKETERVRALIKNAKGQVSEEEARRKIAELTKKAFHGREGVFIKEFDDIDDDSEIRYVIFLESVNDDLELVKEFLRGYTYQNTLIPIIPKTPSSPLEDFEIKDKVKEIIAARKLAERFGDERQEKKKKAVTFAKTNEEKLVERIGSKYGKAIRWIKRGESIESMPRTVDPRINDIKNTLRSPTEYLGEKILNEIEDKEEGVRAGDLLHDFKKIRKYPFVFDTNEFYAAIKDLCHRKKLIIGDNRNPIKYYGDAKSQIFVNADNTILHHIHKPTYVNFDGEISAVRPKVGGEITYRWSIENQKDHAQDIALELYYDGERIKKYEEKIPAGKEDEFTYTFSINTSGEHTAAIKYEGDLKATKTFNVKEPEERGELTITDCNITPSEIFKGGEIRFEGTIKNETSTTKESTIDLFLQDEKVDTIHEKVDSHSEKRFSANYTIHEQGKIVAIMEDEAGELVRKTITVKPKIVEKKIKGRGNSPRILANNLESSLIQRDKVKKLTLEYSFDEPIEIDKESLLDFIGNIEQETELPGEKQIICWLEVLRRES